MLKSTHNSWEPEENLTADLIDGFQEAASKPKPKKRRLSTTAASIKDEPLLKASYVAPSSSISTHIFKEENIDMDEWNRFDRMPDRIIGAKLDQNGHITFLIKWENSNDCDLGVWPFDKCFLFSPDNQLILFFFF